MAAGGRLMLAPPVHAPGSISCRDKRISGHCRQWKRRNRTTRIGNRLIKTSPFSLKWLPECAEKTGVPFE